MKSKDHSFPLSIADKLREVAVEEDGKFPQATSVLIAVKYGDSEDTRYIFHGMDKFEALALCALAQFDISRSLRNLDSENETPIEDSGE